MKRLRLDLVIRICMRSLVLSGTMMTCCALAQGSFWMRNWGGGVNAPVFDADGDRLFGSNYVAMLYGGVTTDSLTPAIIYVSSVDMSPAPFTGVTLNGQVGYFDGGAVRIRDVPSGGVAWLQLVAWDRRLGDSYDSVVSLGIGGFGASQLFQVTSGCPGCAPPILPSYLVGLQSFNIAAIVPEPGMDFLLFLGLAFLATRSVWPCQSSK